MADKQKNMLYRSLAYGLRGMTSHFGLFIKSILIAAVGFIALLSLAILTNELFFSEIQTRWILISKAVIFATILLLFIFWIGFGLLRSCLALYDTGKTSLKLLFPPPLLFMRGISVVLITFCISVLMEILMVNVSILFIVPLIYFWILSYFTQVAIADQKGILEAFSISFRIANNNKITTSISFVLFILLGTILAPIILLSMVYLYRNLSVKASN